MTNKDFLSEFLGNQARARILRLFMTGPDIQYSLDEVCKKTQMTDRGKVHRELNSLTRLGMLKTALGPSAPVLVTRKKSRKKKKLPRIKMWLSDREHPYAQVLRLFVRDTQTPIDEGIVKELRRAGRIRLVIVSGGFLDANEGGHIDILLVGDNLQEEKIKMALRSVEAERGREMNYAVFSQKEFKYRLDVQDRLVRDVLDYPHHVLFDKLNLL